MKLLTPILLVPFALLTTASDPCADGNVNTNPVTTEPIRWSQSKCPPKSVSILYFSDPVSVFSVSAPTKAIIEAREDELKPICFDQNGKPTTDLSQCVSVQGEAAKHEVESAEGQPICVTVKPGEKSDSKYPVCTFEDEVTNVKARGEEVDSRGLQPCKTSFDCKEKRKICDDGFCLFPLPRAGSERRDIADKDLNPFTDDADGRRVNCSDDDECYGWPCRGGVCRFDKARSVEVKGQDCLKNTDCPGIYSVCENNHCRYGGGVKQARDQDVAGRVCPRYMKGRTDELACLAGCCGIPEA